MAIGNVVPITPSRLPVSAGRRKVAEAAALLQQGLTELYEEERAKADAPARLNAEMDAKAARRVQLAQARLATKGLRIEVDRKWLWNFAGEAVEMLRACAADAKRRGETSDARTIERHIDDMCDQLEKLQQKDKP